MTFDPKTATQEQFEAEARRTHQLLLDRINDLTEEERVACMKFGMPHVLHPKLHLNRISSLDALNQNIATCLEHYRNDVWQSSNEYVSAVRSQKGKGHIEAQKKIFYARMFGQEQDKAKESVAVSDSTLYYARRMEKRQRSEAGKKRWAEIGRKLQE